MFLSYARSTEEQATHVESALRAEGYSVWRDTELPAHLSYAEVIEERLKAAKAVLVLWSAEAAKSQWVRAEADAARERGTLVQSSVDGTVPPIPFNQIQCADLKNWNGEEDHAGWRKLHTSIVALAGQVEEPARAARKKASSRICVLPFVNNSGDAVPDYFTDGLTEDITSDLAKAGGLAVVPRKTAFRFKGQDVDAASVAEQLGAGYVLEGTVRRSGDRIRVTAQLTEGSSGDPVWSDRYTRDFTDEFAVQDEVSKTIVEAVRTRLLPDSERDDEDPAKEAPRATKPARATPEPAPVIAPDEEAIAEAEVDEVPVSLVDRSFGDGFVEAEPYAEGGWTDAGNWDEPDKADGRRFQFSDNAPRLIALGLVALLAFVLIRVFYWPARDTPLVKAEEKLSYTVTATVNVRSLPSRYNSRILGTLDKGATINVVPNLAGAQPDWLKIQEGPYVGGYVWRESTRPLTGEADAEASDNAADRPDATG